MYFDLLVIAILYLLVLIVLSLGCHIEAIFHFIFSIKPLLLEIYETVVDLQDNLGLCWFLIHE